MDTRAAITFLGRAAVTSVVLSSLAVLLFVGILPRTGAYKTLTVLSGSMEPVFSPGDVVVARPTPIDSVKLGDVLVYSIPVGAHQVESHRIVEIVSRHPKLVVRTKGDANDEADPWTAELEGDRVWTVRKSVPYVGNAILWLRSPRMHKITTLLVPAIVVLLVLRAIWRRREEEDLVDAHVHRP